MQGSLTFTFKVIWPFHPVFQETTVNVALVYWFGSMSILYTDLGWTKGSYPSQGAFLLFCLARVILLLVDSQSKFTSLLPPSFRVASLWIVDSASTKYWLTTHESYISVTGLYKEITKRFCISIHIIEMVVNFLWTELYQWMKYHQGWNMKIQKQWFHTKMGNTIRIWNAIHLELDLGLWLKPIKDKSYDS